LLERFAGLGWVWPVRPLPSVPHLLRCAVLLLRRHACLPACLPVCTQVEEWEVGLTGPMSAIQAALLEVLDGLIKELRRTNTRIDP
jgi:hypothetical protein